MVDLDENDSDDVPLIMKNISKVEIDD